MSDDSGKNETTRRIFMVGGAAAAIGAAAAGRIRPDKITDEQARLIDKVSAAATTSASLSDIKHVVILMQENRSFDHYFGTLSGVRGFSDPNAAKNANGTPIFDQYGYQPGSGPSASGYLQPFHLVNNPPSENGEDTNDIAHDWVTQHDSWNGGKLDSFVTAHLSADGDTNGPVTMGYFTSSELAFYYALADAFTICDGYHCSVLGPTDPNRLMAISASIDPSGSHGGPVITTASDRVGMTGKLSWQTMPEALLAAGVSWKVYNDPTGILGLGVLSYFKNYTNPFSLTGLELIAKGLTPSFPGDFESDVKSGSLPSVSWIVPPLAECEHPAAPPEWGEYLVQQILSILVSNPDVWAQTVFIVNYDENGGFFDHVPPPAAPAGTAGEYLTGTAAKRGGRHRRPGRPRLPHPGPGHLPVQRRRLQVLGHARPHEHASPHRDPLRRHRAQPVRLASLRHRRLHRRAQPHESSGDRGPRPPVHLDRLEPHRRRRGRAQRPHRHPGRRPPLPAAHKQLHARPGDNPRQAPGPVAQAGPAARDQRVNSVRQVRKASVTRAFLTSGAE